MTNASSDAGFRACAGTGWLSRGWLLLGFLSAHAAGQDGDLRVTSLPVASTWSLVRVKLAAPSVCAATVQSAAELLSVAAVRWIVLPVTVVDAADQSAMSARAGPANCIYLPSSRVP